jgi:hypothetical protein
MRLNLCKGQNVTEYAVLLAIVVAALTGMQVYMKRCVQASIKFCSDQIGEQEPLEKDPLKGELEQAVSFDTADGTTTITYTKGTQDNAISQTAAKGEGSYSLYRAGFTEGNFYKENNE